MNKKKNAMEITWRKQIKHENSRISREWWKQMEE